MITHSQGGAVMHGSISSLPGDVKSAIIAAVMFGDSRNLQDKGKIPNYAPSNTLIICLPLDAVCLGTDFLTPPHLLYGQVSIDQASKFVKSKVGQ